MPLSRLLHFSVRRKMQPGTAARRRCLRETRPAGGPVAGSLQKSAGRPRGRPASIRSVLLETDQGVTVTVKFVLFPALFHFTVFEDV